MSSEQHAPSAGEYITHHLQHLQKDFSFNSVKQTSIVDFSLYNLDSLVVGTFLGFLAVAFLWIGARKATSGVPGRWQAAVEMLVEMVDNQAKGVIHNENSRRFIAPMALMVFVWSCKLAKRSCLLHGRLYKPAGKRRMLRLLRELQPMQLWQSYASNWSLAAVRRMPRLLRELQPMQLWQSYAGD